MSVVDILTEATIRRPVDVVSAYAADPMNAPEWYANIERVDWETPPPAQVGCRVAFVARFLGRRLAYTYARVWAIRAAMRLRIAHSRLAYTRELVEWVPSERLVMRTSQGPFRWRRPTPGKPPATAPGRPAPRSGVALTVLFN